MRGWRARVEQTGPIRDRETRAAPSASASIRDPAATFGAGAGGAPGDSTTDSTAETPSSAPAGAAIGACWSGSGFQVKIAEGVVTFGARVFGGAGSAAAG